MAIVHTFIYCESSIMDVVPQGQQPKLHIIGPMQVILPMFIPGLFSFGVTFGLLDYNTEVTHTMRYTFKGPGENVPSVIDTHEIPVQIQPADSKIPEDMRGMMMNFDFRNVVMENEGTYLSEIYFDGVKIGEFPIKVRQVVKQSVVNNVHN